MWQTIIHALFILSAVGIALVDKLSTTAAPQSIQKFGKKPPTPRTRCVLAAPPRGLLALGRPKRRKKPPCARMGAFLWAEHRDPAPGRYPENIRPRP